MIMPKTKRPRPTPADYADMIAAVGILARHDVSVDGITKMWCRLSAE